MPRSSGSAVKDLCDAQDLIAQAAQKVTGARLATVRLSGAVDDFRGTPLDQKLDKLGGLLTEITYEVLDPAIRDLAALIPSPEEKPDDPA